MLVSHPGSNEKVTGLSDTTYDINSLRNIRVCGDICFTKRWVEQ